MTFDHVAPFYDRLARLVFGRTLERAQLVLLDRLPTGGHWLILGGGAGWLLEQVLNRCQPDAVLYLEASERMLTITQQRTQSHAARSRVTFKLGTEANLTPNDTFDVILTPFVLDLFREEWLAERMIPPLVKALKPGGYWLVTDFVPTNIWWQNTLAKSMLLFFGLTANLRTNRLPNWQPLVQTYLPLLEQEQALRGMVRSTLFKQAYEATT